MGPEVDSSLPIVEYGMRMKEALEVVLLPESDYPYPKNIANRRAWTMTCFDGSKFELESNELKQGFIEFENLHQEPYESEQFGIVISKGYHIDTVWRSHTRVRQNPQDVDIDVLYPALLQNQNGRPIYDRTTIGVRYEQNQVLYGKTVLLPYWYRTISFDPINTHPNTWKKWISNNKLSEWAFGQSAIYKSRNEHFGFAHLGIRKVWEVTVEPMIDERSAVVLSANSKKVCLYQAFPEMYAPDITHMRGIAENRITFGFDAKLV